MDGPTAVRIRHMLPAYARVEMTDNIRRMLKAFADATPAEFTRVDLGPLSFESAVPVFERLFRFVNEVVAQVDPSLLPDTKLEEFEKTLRSLYERFVEVRDFRADPASANPFEARDDIVRKFGGLHEALLSTFAPLVACASHPSAVFHDARSEAERAAASLTKLEKDKRTELETVLTEMRELARKTKEAAQETGVATHSAIFSDVAALHEKLAVRWLCSLVCLTLAAAGAAVWSLSWTFANRETLGKFAMVPATQFTLAKLLIASLLLSAIVWSAHIYRAHRHNAVINRHRQHALSTFETFVRATSDQETKNAVLLQTTQSIFAPQATGYMTDESDVGGATKIIEIVRGLAESKKS